MIITGLSEIDTFIVGEDMEAGDKVGVNEPNVAVKRTAQHVLIGVAAKPLRIGMRARLVNGWALEPV